MLYPGLWILLVAMGPILITVVFLALEWSDSRSIVYTEKEE